MRLRRLATKAHEYDNAQGSTKRERRMGGVGEVEAGVPARLAQLPELGLRDAQALLSRLLTISPLSTLCVLFPMLFKPLFKKTGKVLHVASESLNIYIYILYCIFFVDVAFHGCLWRFLSLCSLQPCNFATLSVALGQEGRKRVAYYITCVYLLRGF